MVELAQFMLWQVIGYKHKPGHGGLSITLFPTVKLREYKTCVTQTGANGIYTKILEHLGKRQTACLLPWNTSSG